MRRIGWLLAAILIGAVTASAQDTPSHEGQRAPAPTLGRSSEVRRTDTVNDYRKLRSIHNLYIDRIDNGLGEKLVETLGRLGFFKIVSKKKEADAVVTGSCLESRRLKRLHSEVFISDRSGGSVWQDNIYRPYNPPSLEKAVNDTAEIVAEHLNASMRESTVK